MRERMEEAVREAAAEFLNREASRQSMITVTRAELSSDGAHGVVYISVFPEEREQQALEFANRQRGELANFFKKRVRGHMPRIEFQLDLGEKNRRRLDELTP